MPMTSSSSRRGAVRVNVLSKKKSMLLLFKITSIVVARRGFRLLFVVIVKAKHKHRRQTATITPARRNPPQPLFLFGASQSEEEKAQGFSQHIFCRCAFIPMPQLLCRNTHQRSANGHYFSSEIFQYLLIVLLVVLSEISKVSSMRLVVQRVKSASVTVEGKIISSIGPGMLALVGLHENDTEQDLEYCCKRLLACKLWANDNGGMWRHGVKQRNLEVLCVSQFTLYGTLSKKNQPDYKLAMKAIPAQVLYSQFLDMLKAGYEAEKIKDGAFGAMMNVALVNDGPVTIMIESTPQPTETVGDGDDAKTESQT